MATIFGNVQSDVVQVKAMSFAGKEIAIAFGSNWWSAVRSLCEKIDAKTITKWKYRPDKNESEKVFSVGNVSVGWIVIRGDLEGADW